MLIVPTELRASRIHGVGVFLQAPVKKGALIWRFDSRIDRIYSPSEAGTLPKNAQRYFFVYCYWHEITDLYVMYGDNARYVNHSDKPDLLSSGSVFGDLRAARNLAAGTEMTVNYRVHCDFVRLTGKFS